MEAVFAAVSKGLRKVLCDFWLRTYSKSQFPHLEWMGWLTGTGLFPGVPSYSVDGGIRASPTCSERSMHNGLCPLPEGCGLVCEWPVPPGLRQLRKAGSQGLSLSSWSETHWTVRPSNNSKSWWQWQIREQSISSGVDKTWAHGSVTETGIIFPTVFCHRLCSNTFNFFPTMLCECGQFD